MLHGKGRLAVIGAGLAAAIATVTLAAVGVILPGHPRLAVVPRHFATLTRQQRVILAFARKDGVGSGILYVWGGTTRAGFDCSGFVWHVVNAAGIHTIPRTSYTMWHSGRAVHRGDIRPGDVLFFVGSDGTRTNPGHVGMYLGSNKFVEYYTTGRPAHYARLPRSDYLGARRWWRPLQIRKRDYYQAVGVARHWNLKIAGHSGDSVVFITRNRRHTFAAWKRRAIINWAHTHHHPVRGYWKHININLRPR